MRESPGEAHCHEGGAAGDPRRNTPGPGLSKLNSKAPSRAPHSRERGGPAVQTRCQRYFQASPIDATFTLEGGTEPDGMSGVHRGTACGG
jgi:hypothetical protein